MIYGASDFHPCSFWAIIGAVLCMQGPLVAEPLEAGVNAYENGRYSDAFEVLMPAAKAGDARAQFLVGKMYEKGKGVSRDYLESAKWYEQAAAQNNAEAQFSLGGMFEYGMGVEKNNAKAAEFYQAAATVGHTEAAESLAFMVKRGLVKPEQASPPPIPPVPIPVLKPTPTNTPAVTPPTNWPPLKPISTNQVDNLGPTGTPAVITTTNQPPQGKGGGRLQVGARVEVAAQEVPAGGGTVQVQRPGDPLDGFSIIVPGQAFAEARKFTVSQSPITTHSFAPDFHPSSPLIHIENGGGYSKGVMKMQIPVQIPSNRVGLVFRYDEKTGQLTPMPVVASSAGSLTIITTHFSDYVAGDFAKESGLPGTPFTADSGFDPKRDGWPFVNYGPFPESGGICFGMAVGAAWYYAVHGPGLFQLADNYPLPFKTPELQDDDSVGRAFATAIQGTPDTNTAISWAREWDEHYSMSHIDLFWRIYWAIKMTGRPQHISVHSVNAEETAVNCSHSILATAAAITPKGFTLSLYDPNTSGLCRSLTLDLTTEKFPNYKSAPSAEDFEKKRFTDYNRISWQPIEAFEAWSKAEDLWTAATRGKFDARFPSYSIELQDDEGKDILLVDVNPASIPLGYAAQLPAGSKPYKSLIMPKDESILNPGLPPVWLIDRYPDAAKQYGEAVLVTIKGVPPGAKAETWAGAHWFKLGDAAPEQDPNKLSGDLKDGLAPGFVFDISLPLPDGKKPEQYKVVLYPPNVSPLQKDLNDIGESPGLTVQYLTRAKIIDDKVVNNTLHVTAQFLKGQAKDPGPMVIVVLRQDGVGSEHWFNANMKRFDEQHARQQAWMESLPTEKRALMDSEDKIPPEYRVTPAPVMPPEDQPISQADYAMLPINWREPAPIIDLPKGWTLERKDWGTWVFRGQENDMGAHVGHSVCGSITILSSPQGPNDLKADSDTKEAPENFEVNGFAGVLYRSSSAFSSYGAPIEHLDLQWEKPGADEEIASDRHYDYPLNISARVLRHQQVVQFNVNIRTEGFKKSAKGQVVYDGIPNRPAVEKAVQEKCLKVIKSFRLGMNP